MSPEAHQMSQAEVHDESGAIEGRFNRLILYPGNAFHSIDMRDVTASRTISDARLTQRIFLNALS